MSCGYNCEYSCEECDVPDKVIEFVKGYDKALKDFVELYKSKTSMENRLVDELAEQLKRGISYDR